MRLLSLFSGIGAFEKALDRENIPYELVNFCEIDKFAVKSYCAIHGVAEDKNLGDISKVANDDIPDCDLVTFGFPCVPKGSMVKTINGYVAIENIAVGDMVLTHNNRYKKVLRTMNRVSDHIYHIKGAGVSDLRITGEHPLYVLRNGKFEWVKVKDLKTTDMLTYNIHQGETSTGYSKDTLWLMGRYCADGYRENHAMHRPIFCIGRNKIDDFEKHLGGISYSVGHTERNCIEYKVLDTEFSTLLDSFGTGSTKKVIPQEIIEAPVDEVMAFLDGYLAGDGHKRKDRNEVMFCTASEQMGLGLALLVARVEHIVPSVYKRVDTRKESFSDTFCYQFSPRSAKQSVVNDKICTHIKSILKEDTDIEVFNIEVEDDNSYTVSNVIVHNCQDVSIAGNQKGIVAGQTRSGLLYEALRIIEAKKPSYAICENVKNLVSKKFKADFDNLLAILDSYGYNSYWQVLNAKDYGIPQNRERVFVISIRKDVDDGTFKFPEKFPLELRLKDMLEETVDEKFYLTPAHIKYLNVDEPKGKDIIHVGKTKSGGQKADIMSFDGMCSCLNATDYKQPKQIITPAYESVTQINDNYVRLNGGKIGKMTDIYRRAYYEDGVSPTLHTCPGGNTEAKVILLDDTQGFDDTRVYKDYSPTLRAARSGLKVATDFRIRKLTPKECWRLMGFDDSDFDKAKYRTEIKYLRGDEKCGANLKAVSEKPKPNDMATYVLCTTKDLKDMEILKTIKKSSVEMPEQEKMQNVNFVIEKLAEMERLGCAISTTKCIDFMGTHFILMEELDRHTMVIIAAVKKGKGNTVKYMKITTELNLPATKLYTILTLFVQIIQSKIFTSTTVRANIQGSIAITENSENNFLMQLSNLKMESIIEQMSNSALYKQAGNSIVVNVLQYIFRNLFSELPPT